jgi:phenylpropionate dioxygenase-like ring-hydroxylating dioxygenase large terminal subunit
MYAKNAWYVAAWVQDLEPENLIGLTVLGQPIVLWRANGRAIAMEDRCVHRLAPLSRGRCEGAKLRCMYHGMLYDSGGRVVEIPGQTQIPSEAKVRTFPVVEKHSWLWVWMGDPARADEALIPPAIGFDDPKNWILGRGCLNYAAEARLVNDNLLDFSHFSYVHEQSLKAGPEYAAQPPNVIALQSGVRFERWLQENTPRAQGANGPCDSWQEYEYHIPGVLSNWRGDYPRGTAESCNFRRPDPARAEYLTCSSQAVTPTGTKTARYFFSYGIHRDHGDDVSRDKMMALLAEVFAEDRSMIEAQQRIIDLTPEPKIVPTAHDRGTTMFNAKVATLIREERQVSGGSTSTTPLIVGMSIGAHKAVLPTP